MGGDDQWSNIISGVDLVRRVLNEQVFGMTFTLLTTSEGKKMGKTEKGALWLDPEKTSPYEFYQYWRNVDDADVEKCLSLLTFLPMEEVRRLSALKDAEINMAKEILAFEVTNLVHGEEEATKAQEASRALFSKGTKMENVPTAEMDASMAEAGVDLLSLLYDLKFIPSKSEGVRLIKQNGLSIDGEKVKDTKFKVTKDLFNEGKILVRKGKKKYLQIVLK